MKQKHKLLLFEIGMVLCLLTIALVAFRITDLVGWNWWYVFAPVWIPTALLVLIVLCALLWYLWNRRAIEAKNGIVDQATDISD